MDEIGTLAKEAISDAGSEVKPVLESIGNWVAPSASPAAIPIRSEG
jgi:hypothetical protein